MPEFSTDQLFARLKASCIDDWQAYTGHDFVHQLANGTLAETAFRHYLGQDYLFLVHFARAYALAAYKTTDLGEMREAIAAVDNILNTEMALHIDFCQVWGLDETAMTAQREAKATMAYTRFVLETGMAGDSLDLYAALAPCVIGYGEIGAALAAAPDTVMTNNPYASWIEMYAGAEYQDLATAAITKLDRLAEQRLTPARFDALARTFRQATILEADFWQMGLNQTS
ncbi:MAG: thiaminase II [Rhodospirillaceae bacterium]|jgi:thiaminase/transcriptional activator TenA|nr:thiaminase II [Rhodospirillaceae bacterium]MBT4045360.1 thiaminase II [Rhodospirillaceae bacterium]MBT4691617.1 thiaminase II [Rhodospirillaceae bacterium]MBT5081269.1 thiaminase II [Rhodospirillaceae bacterium]MBT5523727.1 thiaminase II [Rhodospirillaceae bacterium]